MENKKLILLIDDDYICNTVNKILIRKKFHQDVEILTFIDPVEALKALGRFLDGHLYNKIIILLDLNMSVMDGWEFLDEYRMLSKNNTAVNISILSSSLHQRDVDRASNDPNVSDFLIKPISDEVLEKLHVWIN